LLYVLDIVQIKVFKQCLIPYQGLYLLDAQTCFGIPVTPRY